MLGTAFTTVTGLLDKRFTLNALLPSTLFGLGIVVVWATTGEGLERGIERLADLDGTTKSAIALLIVGILVLFAIALSSQSSNLLAAFSGYRGPLAGGPLASLGTHWWKNVQTYNNHARSDRPAFDVPVEREVAGTAMGTLGCANADYLSRTYGIDVATIWPRLVPVLPADLISRIESSESSMEQTLAVSTLVGLFGPIAGSIAAYHGCPALTTVLLPLVSMGASFMFYRAALAPARLWSELVRTSFDLHRTKLIDALQLPRPTNTEEERALWKQLNGVLIAQDQRPLSLLAPKA